MKTTIAKISAAAVILAVMTIPLSAQNVTESKGTEYYKSGFNARAKHLLLEDLRKNTGNKSDVYFYLGETYFREGKTDSAAYYYGKSLETDPSSFLAKTGQAKLKIKNDPTGATGAFKDILSGKNKKNAELYVLAGRAYLDNKDYAQAEKYATDALGIDGKLSDAYILRGDIFAAEKNYGKAAEQYQQAIYFTPSKHEAYIKYSQLYSTANYALAVEMLDRLIASDPSSALAYRELAEVNYVNGRFSKAEQAYEKYLSLDDYYSPEEREKYASILFYNKNYEKSMEVTEEALKNDPANFVMQRLYMYNCFELGKYASGAEKGAAFMDNGGADKHIYLDYVYYGRLLLKNGDSERAVAQFEKALSTGNKKAELYRELGEIYQQAGDYDNAAKYFALFIETGGNEVRPSDYLMLGRCNYYAASDTSQVYSEHKDEYINAADSAFAVLSEKAPDSYLGYFWRARINSVKDPETTMGLAKPYYEKACSILEGSEGNQKQLVEAYSYLAYYYYLKEDMETSKTYWNKILVIDPENQTAIKALRSIK